MLNCKCVNENIEDLNKQYGLDIEKELIEALTNAIDQEIVKGVISIGEEDEKEKINQEKIAQAEKRYNKLNDILNE
jgi:hypothetical protein